MEKSILVSMIAVFAVLTLLSVVNASVDVGDLTNNFDITVDGIEYDSYATIGIEAGETIPIKVIFTANIDAENAKLKVWIDGHRSDIMDKTGRFELVNESSYSKKLSLEVPSDIDPTEDYTLRVRLSGRDKDTDENLDDEDEFELVVQRESYNLEILSIETEDKVTPGSVIAVDVVLKNWGWHKLEDVYVKAKIPDLGLERKVYFGDLDPLDEDEIQELDEEETFREANRKDATERRIYLTIPDNTKSGIYNLEVEAYNADSTSVVKKSIVVSGIGEVSDVLSGIGARSLDVGQEVTYDLVIVNSGNKMKVYTLTPEEAEGLLIDADSIVTVSADSSKTVKVKVKATESAEEGTHIVTINVGSEGELVKTVNFTANIERGQVANSVVILTVILAIIFVVLLIVLIVLLTRKPAAEETEETSYY